MERKIGGIFKHGDEWYQCVESQDGSCKHCDMNFEGKCPIPIKECTESGRSDKSYVIFKKLEKVGEPFTIVGKLYQYYKVFDIDNVCGDGPWCVYNYKAKTLTIEIKQNKEEMEEINNPNFSNTENIGKNLKPFDLEAAKAGKPVCTRDGRKARIICFDAKCTLPIIALVTNTGGNESLIRYYSNGSFTNLNEAGCDLMMLPEKKEGWIVVRRSDIYENEEEAREALLDSYGAMMVRKITWEE